MKAIGTGHAFGVLWRDLEVVRRVRPPHCSFTAPPASTSRASAPSRALLTITHTDTLALAHVILVGDRVNAG